MTEKADIWMPLFIGDYLASTSRLTTEQHGAYMLLIMDYWKNGPIPDNNAILAQIARMTPDAWSIARAVLEHFFIIDNGEWRHARIEKELANAADQKQKNKERAKAAAQARWSKNDSPDSNLSNATSNAISNATSTTKAFLEECPSPSPSPSPLQTPKPTPEGIGADAPAGKPAKQSRGSKIPDDFEPTEDHRLLAGELKISLTDEVKKFRDHFKANGKPLKDWNAALNNWLRRAKEFQRGNGSGPQAAGNTSAHVGFANREYTSHTPDWAREDV